MATKKQLKKVIKKTSTPKRGKPATPHLLSDVAIDKLAGDIVKAVDYDTFKAIFGDDPEDPEHAEAERERIRSVVRKHLGG